MHRRVKGRRSSLYLVREPAAPAAPATPSPEQLTLLADMLAERLRGAAAPPARRTKLLDLAKGWLARQQLVCPDNERRHIEHLRAVHSMTEGELLPSVAEGHLRSLLKTEGGRLSPQSVNKVQATWRRIVRDAQFNGEWGPKNPFALVRRQREPKRTYTTLTAQQLANVIAVTAPLSRQRLFRVSGILGGRKGEWFAVTKGDLDKDRLTITIRRSHERNTTKTGKPRTIPIPEMLVDDFLGQLRDSPSELLFPAKDGRRMRRDAKLSRALRVALVDAGIVDGWVLKCRRKNCGFSRPAEDDRPRRCPKCEFRLWPVGVPKPLRYYDLRHTANTLMLEAGVEPWVRKMVMGHGGDLNDSRYSHASTEFVRRELEKVRLPPPDGFPPPDSDDEGFESGRPGSNRRPRAWEARGRGFRSQDRQKRGSGSGVSLRDTLLRVSDVAALLRCSTAFVYRLVAKESLQPIRIGTAYRFSRDAVEKFIRKGGSNVRPELPNQKPGRGRPSRRKK